MQLSTSHLVSHTPWSSIIAIMKRLFCVSLVGTASFVFRLDLSLLHKQVGRGSADFLMCCWVSIGGMNSDVKGQQL